MTDDSKPINLILATDSLYPPLTGIGYYTAHLLDEFLRHPGIGRLRGLDDHGFSEREQLAQLVKLAKQGQLGWLPHDLDSTEDYKNGGNGALNGDLVSAAKKVLRHVPGMSALSAYRRNRRQQAALEQNRAAQAQRGAGQPWLLHAPNYVPPAHDGPTVITVHDLSHLRHPETHPKERIDWLHHHLPRAIAQASQVISVSEFTRRELLELELVDDPDKITVCHNGCDPSFRVHSNEELAQELAKWGLERGGYILSVATLEPRKNMERLLDAYEALPAAVARHYPLVLTGADGWKNDSLRQHIARLSLPHRVITTGYLERPQLQSLLAGAGVFAYLSIYEGFGLPLIEAMASGTPVLTSNTTSLKEVAGDSGFTVDPLDVDAIHGGLFALLEDKTLAAAYRDKGLNRATNFSWKRCAEETLGVYREVMQHAGD